jgi:hypothetical protein
MFALFPIYLMSFCLSLAAHCIHLHSFATCCALHTASAGLTTNAGDAFPLTCCMPGLRVRHCPYSPHFLALRSPLISLQFNSTIHFSFPFLFLQRQSSQFSLGKFQPCSITRPIPGTDLGSRSEKRNAKRTIGTDHASKAVINPLNI